MCVRDIRLEGQDRTEVVHFLEIASIITVRNLVCRTSDRCLGGKFTFTVCDGSILFDQNH